MVQMGMIQEDVSVDGGGGGDGGRDYCSRSDLRVMIRLWSMSLRNVRHLRSKSIWKWCVLHTDRGNRPSPMPAKQMLLLLGK